MNAHIFLSFTLNENTRTMLDADVDATTHRCYSHIHEVELLEINVQKSGYWACIETLGSGIVC